MKVENTEPIKFLVVDVDDDNPIFCGECKFQDTYPYCKFFEEPLKQRLHSDGWQHEVRCRQCRQNFKVTA